MSRNSYSHSLHFQQQLSIELVIDDLKVGEESNYQFEKVDIESYEVNFGEDKLVFKSKDSDTTTVTSMVVKDEKYEEISMEF